MERLLVSFSGGETSAYMAQWLWRNKRDEYEMIFVFANTGQENEETLEFVEKCSNHFGFPVVWVEAVVHHGERKATSHKIVDFQTASRNGEPFEAIISKYGIPHQGMPHCTRELKLHPINSYAKAIGWEDYYSAVGIREDEADRINKNARKLKLVYPLISLRPMTKPKINFWWSQQPFRLNLKGYQGNCKTCWKKADKKLFQIARENDSQFEFFAKMEEKYGNYIPETRLKLIRERGETPKLPITFFRKNRSTHDILKSSKEDNSTVEDDMMNFDLIGGDNCEVYAECGDD